jgi:hypothetical protein
MGLYLQAPPYTYTPLFVTNATTYIQFQISLKFTTIEGNIVPQILHVMQNCCTSVIFKQNNPFWHTKVNGHINYATQRNHDALGCFLTRHHSNESTKYTILLPLRMRQ